MHQPLIAGVYLLLASLGWLTTCIAAHIAEFVAALANSRQSVRQH